MIAQLRTEQESGIGLLMTLLPGPDRKRTPSLYRYRITYRNMNDQDSGCVMTWSVQGGRETYQIALERDQRDRLRWHCTCADSVYRSELSADHRCKHVRGLLECCPIFEPEHAPDVKGEKTELRQSA